MINYQPRYEVNMGHNEREQRTGINLVVNSKGVVTGATLYHAHVGTEKPSDGRTEYKLNKDNKSYSWVAFNSGPHGNRGTMLVEDMATSTSNYILDNNKKHIIDLSVSNEKGHRTVVSYEEFCKTMEKSEAIIHAQGLKQHGATVSNGNTGHHQAHGNNANQRKNYKE